MQSEIKKQQLANIPLRRYLAFILTIIIGIAVSIILFILVNNWEQEHQRIEFESVVKGYANAVQNSLNGNVEALMFLGDFFNNSIFVTRQEFASFVKNVLPRYPGIQAFSWNPLVLDKERADYESSAKEDGFEDFKFTERTEEGTLVRATNRQEYVVVYYIEPLEKNIPALGYDIASNPIRLKAIKKGFSTGKLSSTDRITLVQEKGHQFGILLLLPIYRRDVNSGAMEGHYENRKGFVVEVLRIGDVIETALKGFADEGISLALYDLSADKDKQFLFHWPTSSSDMLAQAVEEKVTRAGLQWKKIIYFAGRQWSIVFNASPLYFKSWHLWQSWILLSFSLLLTFMLAFYLFKKTKHTLEIERKVVQETRTRKILTEEISERHRAEEKAARFGHILEQSLNEIYIFSVETLKFIQVNKGARENLGYSMEELHELTPCDIKPEFTLDSFLALIEPLRTGKTSVIVFKTFHSNKSALV